MSEQMRQYWQERFKQMEEAQHDTSVQKVQEIQEQFEKAQAAIEGKIDAWYQRLAQNNGVSMLEAKKMLTNKEQKAVSYTHLDVYKRQSAHRKNAGRLWRSRRQGDRITKETDTPTDILCMIHGFALAAESTTRLIMIITITARIAVRN